MQVEYLIYISILLAIFYYKSIFYHIFQVFAGFYPQDQGSYVDLKNALDKLTLNDSSVTLHRDNRYIIL